MLQSQKFDGQCEYILKWIPELQDVKKKDIHEWSTKYLEYQDSSVKYCKPIVNYKEARKRSVEMYREVLSKKN